MPLFKITMKQTCEDDDLDYDDREELGEHGINGFVKEWMIQADDEDAALDKFHEVQPIANLGNYDIEVS